MLYTSPHGKPARAQRRTIRRETVWSGERAGRLTAASCLHLAAFFALPFVTAAIYGWALT
jgi:hypothetical protein